MSTCEPPKRRTPYGWQAGRLWALVLAALLLVLAGCSGPKRPDAKPTAPPANVGTPAARRSEPSPRVEVPSRVSPTVSASPPTPDPLVALATADAASRTGSGQDAVRIVRIEARDWPDRSLGCPKPGLGYAQAITPGFIIVAEAGNQHLEYHTDHAAVILCS